MLVLQQQGQLASPSYLANFSYITFCGVLLTLYHGGKDLKTQVCLLTFKMLCCLLDKI